MVGYSCMCAHPHPFSYCENGWTDCAEIWSVVTRPTAMFFCRYHEWITLQVCSASVHQFFISQLLLDTSFWNLVHKPSALNRFGNIYTSAYAIFSAPLYSHLFGPACSLLKRCLSGLDHLEFISTQMTTFQMGLVAKMEDIHVTINSPA